MYVSLIFLKVKRLKTPVQVRDVIGKVSVRRALPRFNFYGVLQQYKMLVNVTLQNNQPIIPVRFIMGKISGIIKFTRREQILFQ